MTLIDFLQFLCFLETQHPIQPSSGYGSQPAFVHQQPIEHHKNEQNQHQSYGHQNSHVEFPKPQIPSIEHQHGNYGQEKPSSGHESKYLLKIFFYNSNF